MDKINKKLEELYLRLGVYKEPLHSKCVNSDSCWNGVDENRICNDGEELAQLYKPYIGKDYQQGKILAIGINMHEYGGYNAEVELAEIASREIKQGKKRTFAKPGYQGSLVWHRLVSYASFILRETRLIDTPKNRPYPNKEELSKAFDYIAVTNSIKCCPWGERSKPTNAMWKCCPDYILKEEIRLLKPKHIIVLGLDNYNRVKDLFNNLIEQNGNETKLVKANFESEEIFIYAFPHPASSQGTSMVRMDELESLLIDEYK